MASPRSRAITSVAQLLSLLILVGCVWTDKAILDSTTRQDLGGEAYFSKTNEEGRDADGCRLVFRRLPDFRYVEEEEAVDGCFGQVFGYFSFRVIGERFGYKIIMFQKEDEEFATEGDGGAIFTGEKGFLVGIAYIEGDNYHVFQFVASRRAGGVRRRPGIFDKFEYVTQSEVSLLAAEFGLSMVDPGIGSFPVIVGAPELKKVEEFFLAALDREYMECFDTCDYENQRRKVRPSASSP
jgi:hypothetical protein